MKLAILGGSFNPVHIGHLFLADTVLRALDYDRVIFVPAYQSPLKNPLDGASPLDRMEMLAASIAGNPRMSLDHCEIRRKGVSYTVDTLLDLIARYAPEGKPGLILGNDLVSSFDKWQSHKEIAELADFIIARRTTSDADNNFPYPHKTLDNEIVDISSHQIREKISQNGNWRYLVPSGARLIIEERALYGHVPEAENKNHLMQNGIKENGSKENGLAETILRIENDVRRSLDFDRYIHSRNVALLSWDLCQHFGLDAKKGYLAGIAHDMCKELGDERLIRLALADGGRLSKLEQKKPGLLHARAAAVLVKKKYGITCEDILEAIRYHTTGASEMCSLSKVVYVADKLEMSRLGVDPELRKLAAMQSRGTTADLENLFLAVLDDTVAHLKSKKLDLSYGTRRLLSAMHRRNHE